MDYNTFTTFNDAYLIPLEDPGAAADEEQSTVTPDNDSTNQLLPSFKTAFGKTRRKMILRTFQQKIDNICDLNSPSPEHLNEDDYAMDVDYFHDEVDDTFGSISPPTLVSPNTEDNEIELEPIAQVSHNISPIPGAEEVIQSKNCPKPLKETEPFHRNSDIVHAKDILLSPPSKPSILPLQENSARIYLDTSNTTSNTSELPLENTINSKDRRRKRIKKKTKTDNLKTTLISSSSTAAAAAASIDPKRPYWCTACNRGFNRKCKLTSHYKSATHSMNVCLSGLPDPILVETKEIVT